VSPRSQALFERKVSRFVEAGLLVPEVFFHTIPAEHLPFDDNSFDFVFSRSTLHHCIRPDVLDQVFRVLRPGGVVVFCENYRGPIMRVLMKAHRRITGRDRGTPTELHGLALAAGLQVVAEKRNYRSTYFSFFFPLYLVWRGVASMQYLIDINYCESFEMVLHKSRQAGCSK
jgi:ubiquinone/menaquinone biosynthesis C-methylase UbiE